MRLMLSSEVIAAVDLAAERGEVIGDDVAATIASWWMSPHPSDRAYVLLAQGSELDDDALTDLAGLDARGMADDSDDPLGNYRDLDALRTWARYMQTGKA